MMAIIQKNRYLTIVIADQNQGSRLRGNLGAVILVDNGGAC